MPRESLMKIAKYRPVIGLLQRSMLSFLAATLSLCIQFESTEAQDFIPRKQSKPPGPPLSPEEALSRMVVPDGFHVELVASEPDLLNPVAMAFDDAGRIYVTESFEYPRHEPGPGRDRIKILSDTDGDGKTDSVKIFAEGLNIPSGIAVGHGGVWVANAPDILFLEDTNGDDVADKSTIIVTGFGRYDTHELPNALTWGPDGYLYGLNGVFNPSVIEQNGRKHQFTCAMFRIHPKTKTFEVFCEGTSNPWGIAFDSVGSSFVSACVIDHLWHLTESAYYLRQGGPYPPHTWWAESIVKHKHQMAAYCGIEYFDSEAFPQAFRNKLYMGNIHGGCINVDRIERSGATYQGFGEPDFLTANDVWFMPVAQKIGPDGCLYVLDWYDRYHCYQDASADPKGVDRGHGRLYRIVHSKRPQNTFPDISKLSDQQLVDAIGNPNLFVRQRAQLELSKRGIQPGSAIAVALEKVALEPSDGKDKFHAIWSLAGSGSLRESFLNTLLDHSNPEIKAWGVRLVGDQFATNEKLVSKCRQLASDPDPRVLVQVAIAATKFHRALGDEEAWITTELQLLRTKTADAFNDPILARTVWQNLKQASDRSRLLIKKHYEVSTDDTLLDSMLERFALMWTDSLPKSNWNKQQISIVSDLFAMSKQIESTKPNLAISILKPLVNRAIKRDFESDEIRSILNPIFQPSKDISWDQLKPADAVDQHRLYLGLIIGNPQAIQVAHKLVMDPAQSPAVRQAILRYVSEESPGIARQALMQALELESSGSRQDRSWRDTAIDLGVEKFHQDDSPKLASLLPKLSAELQSILAERMCQKEPTASLLLEWILEGKLRKEMLSPNRIRLLATQGSQSAKQLVAKVFGTVDVEGTQEREKVVKLMGDQLRGNTRGDAQRGWVVYERICGQCHVMHSKGIEVGPNITANGRGSFDQLLVSVFNPSLVIGDAYRSVTIRTNDGVVITGLLVSRDENRTIVKTQGGKEVTVAADEIEIFQQDKKSLMPEGIEGQLTPQELADLFALLTLEKPPESKDNAEISGTPERLHEKR